MIYFIVTVFMISVIFSIASFRIGNTAANKYYILIATALAATIFFMMYFGKAVVSPRSRNADGSGKTKMDIFSSSTSVGWC